jgi:EmrB/QacA subfamily drug resistance transporter
VILDKHEERYMWLALGVVIVGTFMAILDSSIVNVAIPKMMTIFGAATDQIQWVITGYMLTMAIVIPLTGYLTDRYGSKRVYIFALTAFTIGSALCGFASSTETMIAARVIQAIGGGMIMPVGMSMIFVMIPIEKRGFALGIWGISAMAAPAIGPTLSGYIIQYLNWRLIFTINIPVGIIGVTSAILYLKNTGELHKKSFDFMGAITSAAGLYTLLLALSNGIEKGWTSPYIVGLFVMSVVCLSLFIYIELKHKEPLLDLRIFKTFTFTLSIILSSITTIAMFGVVFLMPLYMQNLRGYSPMQTGIMMLPSAMATGIMMPISGRIYDKYGAKWVTLVGITLLVVCTYQLSKLTLDTNYYKVVFILTIRGFGMGLSMMPSQTAGMNDIPKELVARATALNTTIRQVAGSIGIAVLTTILQHRSIFHGARFGENMNLTSPELIKAQIAMQSTLMKHGISPTVAKLGLFSELKDMITKQITMAGMSDTFLIATFIACTGIPLALLLKKKSIKIEEEKHKEEPIEEILDMEEFKLEVEAEII